jgi:hypothetical protein
VNGEKDLVGLPHPKTLPRPRMPRKQRAAQFAPFAALVGYEELVAATDQQVEEAVETAHRYTGDPAVNHEVAEKLQMMTVGGSQKEDFRYNGPGSISKGKNSKEVAAWQEKEILISAMSWWRNWACCPPARKGGPKEINRVSYNGMKPKFDLREWAPEHEKMSKGITLSEEEARDLCKILFQYFKNRG